MQPSTVFITGVSSGIGHALAAEYLKRGCRVIGLSRQVPRDLTDHASFSFASADLSDVEVAAIAVRQLAAGLPRLDLVILNAGVLGSFGDIGDAGVQEMKRVMDVNLWANKTVLDTLFALQVPISQIVTMSSGAAVNGNRGWRGYAISKAALNMLTMLYATEHSGTHFCALAPGLVDTPMQDQLAAVPHDERYPSLDVIRSKRETAEMPKPSKLAAHLIEVIAGLPDLVASGEFADIRKPPIATG